MPKILSMRVAPWLVLGLLLLACQRSDKSQVPDSSQTAGARLPESASVGDQLHASLADSVRYQNDLTEGYLRRVAVRTARGVDTLAGVLTIQEPIVVGDSIVYGIAHKEHLIADAFAYDARSGALRQMALPSDLARLGLPELSPDGRHLAYLAVDTTLMGYATIAEWPSRRIIYRGPPADLLETDAGVDFVSWKDPRTFEIRLDLTVKLGRRTQRVRGEVDQLEGVHIDTLTREPNPA